MPKENTHLYFAHQVVETLADERMADSIRQEMGVFYFGSVIPDTFYYAKDKEVMRISEYMHGKDGNLTNEFIFDLLKKAKETQSEKDLVFALGYITHCVLDMVFHPIIYYLSGNYYDADPEKADEAIYLHRHLETELDARINQSFYYEKLIKLSFLKDLSFDEVAIKKFKISRSQLLSALKRKARLLKALHYDWLYYVVDFLFVFGLMKRPIYLSIFYRNLKHDDRHLPDFIEYKDLITGEPLKTTVQELFYNARHLAKDRIEAAWAYYHGQIHRPEAMKIIKGESLDCGLEGVPAKDLKYFYNS
jgi:hypothetical protein